MLYEVITQAVQPHEHSSQGVGCGTATLHGVDTDLTRALTRYSVRTLVDTYPDLGGFIRNNFV